MRTSFTLAALAGSAIALPGYGWGGKPKEVKNVHVVVETVVHTVYVTEGYEVPKPTPSPEPVYEAPAVTTVVYEEPTSKYEAPVVVVTPTPTPEPVYESPAPAPVSSAAPAPAPVANGYMGVVAEWREKLGLKALTQDSKLESNAMDTVVAGNGQMVHKLNPGTFGQTLAPGEDNVESFEKVFVGGWLCELPNLPGLNGVCATMSQGWSYEGQTGHAEILTSPNYSKIGCACAKGIWSCDFA
ncbi:hypothetical protein FB567DRAFT_305774 [Paraphoma chrysanthemicola]|uniref:SCP domain-containing protein n=1 Tax=Paraphoma chrysanthemicola TaxID=798071 RepID=A0A8K0RC63_9PLEO|nr:hypothetical protein FB567DRAFT_305774 [Paraphoma chrysanthemicola]